MKKILIISLLLIYALVLFGCDGVDMPWDSDASVGDKVVEDANNKHGIGDSVMKYVSHTDRSLTVVIENTTDSTWQSGNMRDYELQMKKDGEWYRVEPKGDFANTMELMLFAPGQKLEYTFEFYERYGKLGSGEYRVVKNYWANATDTTEAGSFYLDCEFTVE